MPNSVRRTRNRAPTCTSIGPIPLPRPRRDLVFAILPSLGFKEDSTSQGNFSTLSLCRFRHHPQEKPRRSGAPVPLLVPCFLARTRPLLCPCDPCGAARASRPCRVCRPARPALPLAGVKGDKPAATAILHGLARRTAPQTQPPRSGSRVSGWPAQESPAGKRRPQRGQRRR